MPNDLCRIFVSRKTNDRDVFGANTRAGKDLKLLAEGRLEIFDATLIGFGKKWRDVILEEIGKANILLLILTRPTRNEFDWPLYEAGVFGGLSEAGKNLVCIYPEGELPPDQVSAIQGVEATREYIKKLVKDILCDEEFTSTKEPLHRKNYDENPSMIAAIEQEIYDGINGQPGVEIKNTEYINPHMQLELSDGAKPLGGEVKIISDKETLIALFGLPEPPKIPGFWTWGDIETALTDPEADPSRINLQWMRQLERGFKLEEQLSRMFIGKDEKVWTPEVEIIETYENGIVRITVTFSPQAHQIWLTKTDPAVALATSLSLATRIRYEVIETYLNKRLPAMEGGSDAKKSKGFEALEELINEVQHSGFFARHLSGNNVQDAFKAGDIKAISKIEADYGTIIGPKLGKAIKDKDVEGTEEALKLWKENNAEFFSIGIPRYSNLVGIEGFSIDSGHADVVSLRFVGEGKPD